MYTQNTADIWKHMFKQALDDWAAIIQADVIHHELYYVKNEVHKHAGFHPFTTVKTTTSNKPVIHR